MFLERGLYILQERNGEGVAFVEVGDVGVEACEGVLVREQAGVGEFPAKDWGGVSEVLAGGRHCGDAGEEFQRYWGRKITIGDEHDSFCLGAAFWFGDVGLQAADCVDSTGGLSSVESPAEAAGAHADLFRHFVEISGQLRKAK